MSLGVIPGCKRLNEDLFHLMQNRTLIVDFISLCKFRYPQMEVLACSIVRLVSRECLLAGRFSLK